MNQPNIIYTMVDHLHLQTGDSVEHNLTVDEGRQSGWEREAGTGLLGGGMGGGMLLFLNINFISVNIIGKSRVAKEMAILKKNPAAQPRNESPAAQPRNESLAAQPRKESSAAEPMMEGSAAEPRKESFADEPRKESQASTSDDKPSEMKDSVRLSQDVISNEYIPVNFLKETQTLRQSKTFPIGQRYCEYVKVMSSFPKLTAWDKATLKTKIEEILGYEDFKDMKVKDLNLAKYSGFSILEKYSINHGISLK